MNEKDYNEKLQEQLNDKLDQTTKYLAQQTE